MITCNLMGGLGNQLFQIFATIAYAIDNKSSFVFLQTDSIGKRPVYWSNIFANLEIFLRKQLPVIEYKIKEAGFDYDVLPLLTDLFVNYNDKGKDTQFVLLFGYFQSYKYFEKYQNNIMRLLRVENQKEKIKKEMMPYNTMNLISMHFRFGDYKKALDTYVLMPYSYYKNSITYIQSRLQTKQLNILYFCEDQDLEDVLHIINQLTWDFPSIVFDQVTPIVPDYAQMFMMSVCNHNIIANSTFSWWGAYLNSSDNKIVCYPDTWFSRGNKISENVKDLCPPSWNKISII